MGDEAAAEAPQEPRHVLRFLGAFGFGNSAGLKHEKTDQIGGMKVSRNNGEFFIADGLRLTYRKPA